MIMPWAKEEVGTADLGDKRLDARLITLVSELGSRPNLSIPAACQGRAEMTAAYRFFDNQKVTFEKVLEPHVARTRERMATAKVVLMVQDTTEIDVTRPEQEVQGAGVLDGPRRGFFLHEMQAFTPAGIPLGTIWAEAWNRPEVSHAAAAEKSRKRASTPIEEKESMRWLTGLRAARAVAQQLPEVQCVYVADSEADIYELFAEPRGDQPLEWLIRACRDRALEGEEAHLRAQVLATPVLYRAEIRIRARQAKIGVETRKRRVDRKARLAELEIRAATLTLRPSWRHDRKLPPVTVKVVLVSEPHPPADEPPIEWILVTTLPIDTVEDVRRIVAYYCVRWCMEILFRTLKSGCRVERRRFEPIDRLLPCAALYLIIAWRTLFVSRTSRSCPELDCEAIFEPSEWKAVWVAVHHQTPPKKAPLLADMVHRIARLGGYVERPKSEPGVQTIWIGMQRMYDLAWDWDSFGPDTKLSRRLV
jgi:hypothetical protein